MRLPWKKDAQSLSTTASIGMGNMTARTGTEATEAVEPKDDGYFHGTRLAIVLIALALSVLLSALDATVIATAIPSITSKFNSTLDIGWYGSVYPLTICALQPVAGRFQTVFSLKWTFITAFCIFMIGSLLCAVATSSAMFIIGRAIAGMGTAFIFSTGLGIINTIAPLKNRALYTSFMISSFGLATVIAPVIGGALTENVSWRWCFYINLPIGGIVLAILLLFFHPPNKEITLTLAQRLHSLDPIGFALFVPAVFMLLLALQWGGHDYQWKSATIIGLFCGFGGMLVAFLCWEYYKGDSAMVPFSVLGQRAVILSCLFGMVAFGSVLTCAYWLPEWFQVSKGASPERSGVMMLPTVITQTIFATVMGVVTNKTGNYHIFFFIAPAFQAVATGLFTTFKAFGTNSSHWIPYQILLGIGNGLGMQVGLIAVQGALADKPDLLPIGVSTVMFFNYFGSASFLSIALTIFSSRLTRLLKADAGLSELQVDRFLLAGTARVKTLAQTDFPQQFVPIMNSYNRAITDVFFMVVVATGIAFFLGFGVPRTNLLRKPVTEAGEEMKELDQAPIIVPPEKQAIVPEPVSGTIDLSGTKS